jgi:hypothetical protein
MSIPGIKTWTTGRKSSNLPAIIFRHAYLQKGWTSHPYSATELKGKLQGRVHWFKETNQRLKETWGCRSGRIKLGENCAFKPQNTGNALYTIFDRYGPLRFTAIPRSRGEMDRWSPKPAEGETEVRQSVAHMPRTGLGVPDPPRANPGRLTYLARCVGQSNEIPLGRPDQENDLLRQLLLAHHPEGRETGRKTQHGDSPATKPPTETGGNPASPALGKEPYPRRCRCPRVPGGLASPSAGRAQQPRDRPAPPRRALRELPAPAPRRPRERKGAAWGRAGWAEPAGAW